MANRIDLQQELQSLIGQRADGKQNVYFQPPESIKLNYPCIVYTRGTGDTKYAEDRPYKFTNRYILTFITTDPDASLIEKLAMAFKMISHVRYFVSDNLYHSVYELYW